MSSRRKTERVFISKPPETGTKTFERDDSLAMPDEELEESQEIQAIDNEETQDITIIIKRTFHDISGSDKEDIKKLLVSKTGAKSDRISFLYATPGSTHITIRMPRRNVEQLLNLYEREELFIKDSPIVDISTRSSKLRRIRIWFNDWPATTGELYGRDREISFLNQQ